MKIEIKNRVKNAWGSIKGAGTSVKSAIGRVVPSRDRESLVIKRTGKHVKIKNGSHKAKITYGSTARAKEVVSGLFGSAEGAIDSCPIQ